MNIEKAKTQMKLVSFNYECEDGIIKMPTVKLEDVLNMLDALSILSVVSYRRELLKLKDFVKEQKDLQEEITGF